MHISIGAAHSANGNMHYHTVSKFCYFHSGKTKPFGDYIFKKIFKK